MSYSIDLLEQAFHLANLDRNRPKQVNLRRAISTGYYALFHALVSTSLSQLVGRTRLHQNVASVILRSFDHGDIKEVCKIIQQQNVKPSYLQLFPQSNIPQEIKNL